MNSLLELQMMKRMMIFSAIFLFFNVVVLNAEEPKSLVERLGYDKNAKLLIINADDFGMCHSANMGTFKGFEAGGLSSATIMTTCPWFKEAAFWIKEHPQYDVGVHTVLTSEWNAYKWGPVLGWTVPSLCTPEGYFPKDVMEMYAQGDMEEVEQEIRAQVDRALNAGIDVTHIDSHMGTMQLEPKYLTVYANIAKEYNVPCRMPSRDEIEKLYRMGKFYDELFPNQGIVCPDELLRGSAPKVSETEAFWKERLSNLKPGKVTEIFIHCADDSPEMKAMSSSQGIRYAETEFFSNPKTIKWLKDQGITVISYRKLRDLQRNEQ